MGPSPTEVFHKLLAGVTGRRWSELPELYAEDTVVRHPLLPCGGPVLDGREAVRAHFAAAAELPLEMRPRDVVIHQTLDPEVVIGEFRYIGRFTDTGNEFSIPNIFVIRVRNGLIVESRDYVDHLTFARAGGRLDQLLGAFTGAA
jgi:ketosteroid isomerase-like protein